MKMNAFKFFIPAVLVLLVAAIAPVKDGYEVGDTVASFKLKNVDGSMVDLASYKSKKGVIVIFDCNTCPYSQAYNDRIIALNKKYASQGYPVMTINANDSKISPGDSFDEMAKLAKRKNYDFPYLIDETQEVSRAFGATNTPHVYVLKNEGGSFKVAYVGAIDNSAMNAASVTERYVENAVDALLAGKEVPTKSTKAIGCTIKYRPA